MVTIHDAVTVLAIVILITAIVFIAFYAILYRFGMAQKRLQLSGKFAPKSRV